jgi:serine/threonine protein kinase
VLHIRHIAPLAGFFCVAILPRTSLQKRRWLPRSTQVLLGYPYNVAIDMWSLGCMAAELFLGLPLFPGASEHDLLVRIVEMLGMPPLHVLAKAQHTKKYFRREEETLSAGGIPLRRYKYLVSSNWLAGRTGSTMLLPCA